MQADLTITTTGRRRRRRNRGRNSLNSWSWFIESRNSIHIFIFSGDFLNIRHFLLNQSSYSIVHFIQLFPLFLLFINTLHPLDKHSPSPPSCCAACRTPPIDSPDSSHALACGHSVYRSRRATSPDGATESRRTTFERNCKCVRWSAWRSYPRRAADRAVGPCRWTFVAAMFLLVTTTLIETLLPRVAGDLNGQSTCYCCYYSLSHAAQSAQHLSRRVPDSSYY